jgi:hypothetical protein
MPIKAITIRQHNFFPVPDCWVVPTGREALRLAQLFCARSEESNLIVSILCWKQHKHYWPMLHLTFEFQNGGRRLDIDDIRIR